MYVISVPLSQAAMHRLDIDACVAGDLSEIQLDDDEFAVLWHTGIFSQANSVLGVNIDSYEDEAVLGRGRLELLRGLVHACMVEHSSVDALFRLRSQVDIALEHGTGMYLYF